jgi:hypothetical protein
MYAWKKDKSILYSKKEKKQEEENKFKPILFLFL